MANWANPTITSNYITFVDEVKNRDIDAICLQSQAVTNIPVNAVRMLRGAPAYPQMRFQEWNGTAFNELVLSVAGGGTGVTSLAALVPSLGLGSMAYQNSNAVNITGGNIASSYINACILQTTSQYQGPGFNIVSTSSGTALSVSGSANNYQAVFSGGSHGVIIQAGHLNKAESAFLVRNVDFTKNGLHVRGDMGVFCPVGLVIPVGQSAFVPV